MTEKRGFRYENEKYNLGKFDGYTIQNAIKATNADLIDKLVEGTGVFEYKTYGGVYDTIINTKSVSESKDSFMNIEGYTDISKQNMNYVNSNDSEIITYIVDHIDPRFNIDKFEKYEVMTLPDDEPAPIEISGYTLIYEGESIKEEEYSLYCTDSNDETNPIIMDYIELVDTKPEKNGSFLVWVMFHYKLALTLYLLIMRNI